MDRNKLILLVLLSLASAKIAIPQIYIVSSYHSGSVYGYTTPPGTLPVAASTAWSYTGTPFFGLSYDASGNVYSIGNSSPNSYIYKFASGTGVQSTFATAAHIWAGLAVDSSGNVYTYDDTAGELIYYSSAGSGPSVLASISGLGSVAMGIDASNNIYLLTNFGHFYSVSPLGAVTNIRTLTGFATNSYPNGGLVFDSSGNMYVATKNGCCSSAIHGTIAKITPACAVSTLLDFGGNTAGEGLAYDPASNALYAVRQTLSTAVSYQVSLAGAETQFASTALYIANGGQQIAGPATTTTPAFCISAAPACRLSTGFQSFGTVCLP